MKNLLCCRNVAIAVVATVAFALYQALLILNACLVREEAHVCFRRFIPLAAEESREVGYYPNGKDRMTFSIPDDEATTGLDQRCGLYKIDFDWNEIRHIPPDADTNVADVWVGSCTFTPTISWWHLDVFGVVRHTEFNLYGDWRIESTPPGSGWQRPPWKR